MGLRVVCSGAPPKKSMAETLFEADGDLGTGEEVAAPLVNGDEDPYRERSSEVSRSRDALEANEVIELRSLLLARLELLVVRLRRYCDADGAMGLGLQGGSRRSKATRFQSGLRLRRSVTVYLG